jgi:hypothetical protein
MQPSPSHDVRRADRFRARTGHRREPVSPWKMSLFLEGFRGGGRGVSGVKMEVLTTLGKLLICWDFLGSASSRRGVCLDGVARSALSGRQGARGLADEGMRRCNAGSSARGCSVLLHPKRAQPFGRLARDDRGSCRSLRCAIQRRDRFGRADNESVSMNRDS